MSFKTTVREWFRKDDRPDEDQFNNWFNWTRWNDEKIPLADIEGIEEILNDKADREAFETHLTDADAHAELFAEPTARIAALEAKTDSENNWKTITGYSLNPATRVLTMDAGWLGTINGEDYTNLAAQELSPAIPLAAAGYSRIDLIVFKTDGLFERIAGVENLFTPVAPPKPANTLEATFLTVGDGYVNVPVVPKPKAPVTSVNGMRGDVVLNAINDLVTGGIYDFLSAEQGKVLKTQIDGINTLLTSNDVNLDTVQEIVTAIKTVQTSLSTILVNDLTTGGTTKALTAEMGKTLKGLIDGLVVPTATATVRGIVKTDVTKADPVVYTVETADNLLKAKVNAILEIKPITGIAYTLIAYDTANLVQLAYDGTLPMTVTIPNDATLNLPVGSIFYTVGSNTGALTIAGGAGVTFQTAVGLTAGQNETRKYVKKAADTWQVEGSVSSSSIGSKTPYTAYIHTVLGNNTTAVLGDSSKPFLTDAGAYSALPTNDGNAWNFVFLCDNVTRVLTVYQLVRKIKYICHNTGTFNFSCFLAGNYKQIYFDIPNCTLKHIGVTTLQEITSSMPIYINANTMWIESNRVIFNQLTLKSIINLGTFYQRISNNECLRSGTITVERWDSTYGLITFGSDLDLKIDEIVLNGTVSLRFESSRKHLFPARKLSGTGTFNTSNIFEIDISKIECASTASIYVVGGTKLTGKANSLFLGKIYLSTGVQFISGFYGKIEKLVSGDAYGFAPIIQNSTIFLDNNFVVGGNFSDWPSCNYYFNNVEFIQTTNSDLITGFHPSVNITINKTGFIKSTGTSLGVNGSNVTIIDRTPNSF